MDYNYLTEVAVNDFLSRGEEFEIEAALTFFSEARQLIHQVLSDEPNFNFGKFRVNSDVPIPDDFVVHSFSIDFKTSLVTPFVKRYSDIISLDSVTDPGVSCMPDSVKALHKSQPKSRQIVYRNMKLSYLYYETDDALIDKVSFGPRSWISSNPLLYRCVYHTETSQFDRLIREIKTNIDDHKLVYWLLCQATMFCRGSAAITEMVISALKSKHSTVERLVSKLDVQALVSDYSHFDNTYKLSFCKVKHSDRNLDETINKIKYMSEREKAYFISTGKFIEYETGHIERINDMLGDL
jgi:hypothetical protein